MNIFFSVNIIQGRAFIMSQIFMEFWRNLALWKYLLVGHGLHVFHMHLRPLLHVNLMPTVYITAFLCKFYLNCW